MNRNVILQILATAFIALSLYLPANALEPDDGVPMLLWYKFDEQQGQVVTDSSGMGNDAQLVDGEEWATGKIDGAVNLTGNNYILLPDGIVQSLNDFTITTWINQNEVLIWQRLLDFGNDITKYMYFTLNDGAGSRFAINVDNSWQELTALPISDPGTWHFVAVSKSGSNVAIYIDGIKSATSDTIEYNPSDLGPTINNFIGKSQYEADANFNGKIDDFRIYTVSMDELGIQNIMGQSLTDEEIVALNKASVKFEDTFAVEEDMELPTVGSNGVTISWSSSNPAILSDSGVVNKPAEGQGDAVVVLTATFTKNEISDTKVYEITILEEGATPYRIDIDTEKKGVDISPTLYGIFFEDINYALDGGLYPELVQNRSFEFQNLINKEYDGLYAWELLETGGGHGMIATDNIEPIHPNNPNYLTVTVTDVGDGVGVWNTGFPNENTAGQPGMVVKRGERYIFSMFARSADFDGKVQVSIEGSNGTVYAKRTLEGMGENWQKLSCTLIPYRSDDSAKLVVKMMSPGTVDMDMISLFPRQTWKFRENGLRYDLGKMLEEMHPNFVRFPGGCIAEGENIDNIYRWKDTVGSLEERKMNYDLWYSESFPYYHQSFGIGFYEYFQMCEDLKAKAVPVVNAGLTCQARTPVIIPMDELEPFIQDALDLIEFANGGTNTEWGGLRARMGHPKPFNLEYLAVGNENWSQVYFERYEEFARIIRAEYPEIKLITTSGPQAEDGLFMEARAWIQSGQADADLVDEHYYRDPHWFYTNINRYDNYDRSLPKVFVGEYASRGNTMKNALAEAAFMTALEENSDIVAMASYAPLFAKENFLQWTPDLIWFDNSKSYGSVNYYVQKMFMNHVGQLTFPTEIIRHGKESYAITGKFGLGGYNTATAFDEVTIVDNQTQEIIFSDDFSKGGDNWTTAVGEWEILQEQLVQNSIVIPNTLAYAQTEDLTDYTVTLKGRKLQGQEGFLLYFGLKDTANYLRWNLGGYGNTRGSFESVNEGVVATISEFDLTRFNRIEEGEWYTLKAVVSGNRIKCYLNDQLACDIVHNQKYGPLYANATQDARKGEIYIKVVNPSARTWPAQINLKGSPYIKPQGTKIVLKADDPNDQNTLTDPRKIVPSETRVSNISESFTESFAPYSVNILKLKTRRNF